MSARRITARTNQPSASRRSRPAPSARAATIRRPAVSRSATERARETWAVVLSDVDLSEEAPFVAYSEFSSRGVEPRLAAYASMDSDRADALVAAGRYLIPTSGGWYLVSHNMFPALAAPSRTRRLAAPAGPAPEAHLAGEKAHVTYLFNAGVFGDYTGIGDLQPGYWGKSSAPEVLYRVGDARGLSTRGAQMEIDFNAQSTEAGTQVLVEAKIGVRPDTNIRQLALPHLAIGAATGQKVRSLLVEVEEPYRRYRVREMKMTGSDMATARFVRATTYLIG